MRAWIGLILCLLVGCRTAPANPASGALHETTEGVLHPKIQERVSSPHCQPARFCGDIVKLDCGVTVDLPFEFYDNRNGSVVAHCGGMGSGACPPKQWTCPERHPSQLLSGLRIQADAWDAAIVRKDRLAIAANMAESFMQTGNDGRVANKSEFLEAITAAKLVIEPYTVEDFRVRLYGDTALITGRTDMHGSWDGKPFRSNYRFTDTYVLEADGHWRVVNVQTTEIPE